MGLMYLFLAIRRLVARRLHKARSSYSNTPSPISWKLSWHNRIYASIHVIYVDKDTDGWIHVTVDSLVLARHMQILWVNHRDNAESYSF